MPYKAKRPWKHSGCPNLTDRDFCKEHLKEYNYEYNHYRRGGLLGDEVNLAKRDDLGYDYNERKSWRIMV